MLGESLVAVFDKLSSLRLAATAALSSFLLLLASIALFIATRLEQIVQLKTNSSPETIVKIFYLAINDSGSKTVTAISIFSIILVVSCCALAVGFLVLLKRALVRLNKQLERSLAKRERTYNDRLVEGNLSRQEKQSLKTLRILRPIHIVISAFMEVIFFVSLVAILFMMAVFCLVIFWK